MTIRLAAGIDGTTGASQRKYFRVGFGYYPGSAEWPAWFIGFVWWFTDIDYVTDPTGALSSYATLNLKNDPGAGQRTDLFMIEVVTNNNAETIVVGKASEFTGINDFAIEIESGKATFYTVVGGLKGVRASLGAIATHSADSTHGTPVAQMRSRGSANLGGNRFGYLDYYAIRGES